MAVKYNFVSPHRPCHPMSFTQTTNNVMTYFCRNIKFFVLDEADRMLDMGFMPDIERMESHATMPRKGKRQTLMFSATFPDAIQRAASNFLDNYLFLKVGVIGSANSDVTQSIFRCHKFEKRDTLLSIFRDLENIEKTLIFVQQKKMTDFLASYLCQNEVSFYLCESIEGHSV